MFLDSYFSCNTNISRISKTAGTYEAGYDYWSNYLTERVLRLFEWDGTGDIPAREIEIALMLGGSCGVTDKYKKKLTVFSGNYAGDPTEYYDVFKSYAVYSPLYSAVLKVGKDVVVGRNNNVMNSIQPLIHRYAMMLAHTEVTFIDVLIESRNTSVGVASTTTAKTALENYRNSLANGKIMPILDPAFSQIQWTDLKGNSNTSITELLETRKALLNAFFTDIGVQTAWFDKKANVHSEEVKASKGLTLFNINDMLRCRETLCGEVNKRYGTNWSVRISPELIEEEDAYEADKSDSSMEAE